MSLIARRGWLIAVALCGAFITAAVVGATGSGIKREIKLRAAYEGAVSQWPVPWIDPDVAFVELAALPPGVMPDPDKVALGGRLFGDVLLSAHRQLACASCHSPDHGWTIDKPKGERVRRLDARNPPSLYMASRLSHWAWDGNGETHASQTLAPLTTRDEMANIDVDEVIVRLRQDADYARRFAVIYGQAPIDAMQLMDVLVSFQASLDHVSRFYRFMRGERELFTDREIEGLHVFRTKARCANCHYGSLLTDQKFHNLKLSSFGDASADLGRYAVTGVPDDIGRFRTPSLRHVSKTAPYMHHGLFATLEGVINLYDRGGGEIWARNAEEAAHPLYPHAARLSPHIRPLGLSDEEKAALLAFLRTL